MVKFNHLSHTLFTIKPEFLKIDFPKVPFNVNKETFFKMVELGRELRSFHLLEN